MKKAVYVSSGVWQFYFDNGICCINPTGKEEVIFKEEPKQMNEFELLEELIRDFLQIVIVQKKIKKPFRSWWCTFRDSNPGPTD